MIETVECIVAGAGIVGLAIARALARTGREVVVVERNAWIGNETSSRNNEVVHAGFLYAPGSLRARLCRPGAERTWRYCESRGIPCRRIGKLMPAADDAELGMLVRLVEAGRAAGAPELELLDAAGVARLEPALRCAGALHSPFTGVLDTHALMLAYRGDAEDRGAMIALSSAVTSGDVRDGIRLHVAGADGTEMAVGCRVFVNAAGLGARRIALSLTGLAPRFAPKVHYALGRFLSWNGPPPFGRIVVPLGQRLADGGAFTLDSAGRGKFGGDLVWVDEVDYRVPGDLAAKFAGAIRSYWPEIDEGRLSPDYAGIRPRTWGPEEGNGDWTISGPGDHGVPGLVNLLGIETPGVTAALSIADYVLELLGIAPAAED